MIPSLPLLSSKLSWGWHANRNTDTSASLGLMRSRCRLATAMLRFDVPAESVRDSASEELQSKPQNFVQPSSANDVLLSGLEVCQVGSYVAKPATEGSFARHAHLQTSCLSTDSLRSCEVLCSWLMRRCDDRSSAQRRLKQPHQQEMLPAHSKTGSLFRNLN